MISKLPLMIGPKNQPAPNWELVYEFLSDYEDFIEDGAWPYHFEKNTGTLELPLVNNNYSNGMTWPSPSDFPGVISYQNLVDQPFWSTGMLSIFDTEENMRRVGAEIFYHHSYGEQVDLLEDNDLAVVTLVNHSGNFVYSVRRILTQTEYYFLLRIVMQSDVVVEVRTPPKLFVPGEIINSVIKVDLTKTSYSFEVDGIIQRANYPTGEVLYPSESMLYTVNDHRSNSDLNYSPVLTAYTHISLYGNRTDI